MNIIRQHNFQIVNQAKQNKSEPKVIPLGNGATAESAEVMRSIIRHIGHQSNAQAARTTAREFQVMGGIGWWRVVTDYESANSFDQEIYIRRIWDPLSVYMDPDCQEKDCSDAKFAFVFDVISQDDFREQFPEYEENVNMPGPSPLGIGSYDDDWIAKDHIRLAEYFRKVPKQDKLVSFVYRGERQIIRKSHLHKSMFGILDDPATRVRDVWDEVVEWYLIAGQKIIDQTTWPGQWIPLIRCVGEEQLIDGILDRKGHTRAMKDAQRMYNYSAALSLDTPIPTPAGWTTIDQIEKGSVVLDEKGQPIEVAGTTEIWTDRPCFEIKFDDGTKIISDDSHSWRVEERGKRKAATWDWQDKTVSTAELVPGKHYIKLGKPIELDDMDLPVHPYVLGYWLGDGTTEGGKFTVGNQDKENTQRNFEALGCFLSLDHGQSRDGSSVFTVYGLVTKLKEIGVIGDKHIPTAYLRASYQQRLALLQGLMDSDGCFMKYVNACSFTNKNTAIISGIKELLSSLGIKSTVHGNYSQIKVFPNGKEYTSKSTLSVQFTADPNVQIFRLERKRILQQKNRSVHWRRTKRFGIVSITPVESVPVKCIMLNTAEHLYLAGYGMIPTHNSAAVEFGALQSKTPYVAAAKAIEGYETYWNTANQQNHSVLPYNDVDEENPERVLPPPQRTEPPNVAPAYQIGMDTAFNQLMMVSGQWQNQMGMMGNERTGKAISERQEQSDTSVYHFQDNYEDALRYEAKILIDLVPKVYDTRRVKKILANDGVPFEVVIDPSAQKAYLQEQGHERDVIRRIFNPSLGQYDIAPTFGPAYGSRRKETSDALTLILTQAPGLTGIIGDLLLRSLDFDEAQEAALRLKRMVPPQALGEGPTQNEQQMRQQLEQLTGLLGKALQRNAKSELKLVGKDEMRDIDAYKAETDRFKALADSLMLDQGGINQVIEQLVTDSLQTKLSPISAANSSEISDEAGGTPSPATETPPLPGAAKAPDGEWYVLDPTRRGKYLRIAPLAQERPMPGGG